MKAYKSLIYIFIVSSMMTPCIAQDSLGVTRIGRIYDYWDSWGSFALQGDSLYVIGSELHLVDITDLENPEIVACAEFISGNEIILRDNYGCILRTRSNFKIIDINDLSNPNEVFYFDDYHYCNCFEISGDYVFLGGRDGMVILDITNPANPEEIYRSGHMRYTVEDIKIIDHYALIGTEGSNMYVSDISDPGNMQIIDTLYVRGGQYEIEISEELAFVMSMYSVSIFDLSDINDISLVGNFDYQYVEGACLSYMVKSGNYLYLSLAYLNGLTFMVLDITDPSQPYRIETPDLTTYGPILVHDNTAFINIYHDGVHIYNMSDPTSPELLSQICPYGSIDVVEVRDQIAYVGNESVGLQIVDFSDPENMREIGRFEMDDEVIKIKLSGERAFILYRSNEDYSNRIIALNISDPTRPRRICELHPEFQIGSIAVSGDYLFMTNNSPYTPKVYWFHAPAFYEVASFGNPGLTSIVIDDTLLYAVSYDQNNRRYFNIFDISNPESPLFLNSSVIPQGKYTYRVKDGYLYYVNQNNGLLVYSLTDSMSLRLVGRTNIPGDFTGLTAQGNHAFVIGTDFGLKVIDITSPIQPCEVGNYNTPGNVRDVASTGNLVLIAGGTHLGIYDCSEAMHVLEPVKQIQTSYYLYPAYPNPFNSTTTIRYGLPYPGNVSLQVYNPSGQLITTLFKGCQQPGNHITTLTTDDLPSGLYFVQLNADTKTMTQKVMLIR